MLVSKHIYLSAQLPPSGVIMKRNVSLLVAALEIFVSNVDSSYELMAQTWEA
jgi:hypothetical protein